MLALVSLIGMVVYLAVLVLLGINSWALDFRMSTGHPTRNDLILLAIGLAFSIVASLLAFTVWSTKLTIRKLQGRIEDYKNIRLYYYPPNLALSLVEERLSEIAAQWQATRMELGQLKLIDISSKRDYHSIHEEEKRLEASLRGHQQTFVNIYDHAKRVFGKDFPLKERRVDLYLKEQASKVVA